MRKAAWGLCGVCLGIAVGAHAENASQALDSQSAIAERWYVAPMFSYTFADEERLTDDGLGGSLSVGKSLGTGLNIETKILYTTYDVKRDSGDVTLVAGGFDLLAFPSRHVPGFFALFGAAYGSGRSDIPNPPPPPRNDPIKPKPDSEGDSVLFDVGAGYLMGPISFLNDGSLRLEVRYRFDQKARGGRNDFQEPLASIGLLIPLGSAPVPPPPAEPVAVVPPAATCNDTLDNDGDGKTDFPADPGCTSADDSDETDPPPPPPPPCKTPAPGERVSLAGCGTGDTIVLRGVNFDFDQSNLTVNAKAILDNVAEELAKYPDIKVEVGGHTDTKGSDEYNQKLSDRRAASVVKYLEGKGVAVDRMTSVGYGETQPVADNDTDEGRELNRRVELKVTAGVAGGSV